MTRAGVLKLGLGLLLAGGLGYWLFEALGLEGFSAGIAAEALLVVVVVIHRGSEFLRVPCASKKAAAQQWIGTLHAIPWRQWRKTFQLCRRCVGHGRQCQREMPSQVAGGVANRLGAA